jgi:hypothetical protein
VLIGLDLDNTVIDYDAAFSRLGRDMGLLPSDFAGSKRNVRDMLWHEQDGDLRWQRLQAAVYGPGIGEAIPSPGVLDFMASAVAEGHALAIVSHKTRFAAADPEGADLRQSALGWLRQAGIAGPLVRSEAIHFETTRDEKLARIGALGCRYFVDDLEEVLLDPTFPAPTIGVHFVPGAAVSASSTLPAFRTWAEIAAFILDHDCRRSA